MRSNDTSRQHWRPRLVFPENKGTIVVMEWSGEWDMFFLGRHSHMVRWPIEVQLLASPRCMLCAGRWLAPVDAHQLFTALPA